MQMLKWMRGHAAAIAPGSAAMRLLVYVAITVTTASLSGQTQQFQNPSLLTTALDPAALITGDWNGDGHQDLIYIEESPRPRCTFCLAAAREHSARVLLSSCLQGAARSRTRFAEWLPPTLTATAKRTC